MTLLAQLLHEMHEVVQSARHLPESDWRAFSRETGQALAQRKPHPSEFWIVSSMGEGLDYWGPWSTESEARESDVYRWPGGEIIEVEASGTPTQIGRSRKRREAKESTTQRRER